MGQNLADKWNEAFELWMTSLHSKNTRRAYKEAWKFFKENVNKDFWLIGRSDVVKWVENMRSNKLSNCTKQLRLAAISSFYAYVNDEFTTVDKNGKEVQLYTQNPASGKTLRVKIDPYGKAIYLTKDEVKKLLGGIHRNTIPGSRDYALFTTYIYTGRRNSEIRNLKWGDISYSGGKVWYRWSGKGKNNQKAEMPKPAWTAIKDYLSMVGKSENIKENEYIFAIKQRKAGQISFWEDESQNKPISMRYVGKLLKFYAKKAGLDEKKIHVHILRHTAAMLRKEVGDDIETISRFLGHSSLSITQIYLHQVEGLKDESSDLVEELLN